MTESIAVAANTLNVAVSTPSRPMERVAKLVTEIFAPAVMVTTLLIVVGWHAYDYSLAGAAWGATAALFTGVIPFLAILGGVRLGKLTDHHIVRREQRRLPLAIALCCVVGCAGALVALGVKRELLAVLAAGAIGLVVWLIINHWWKMSIHTGIAAGTVLVLVEVFALSALIAAALVPMVAWSRVRLRAHTVAQTVVGAIVGALIAGMFFAALR